MLSSLRKISENFGNFKENGKECHIILLRFRLARCIELIEIDTNYLKKYHCRTVPILNDECNLLSTQFQVIFHYFSSSYLKMNETHERFVARLLAEPMHTPIDFLILHLHSHE